MCLKFVKEARERGLTISVLLMGMILNKFRRLIIQVPSGYYNPLMSYGEEKAIADTKEAGAEGFIIVDLPPEEAVRFRKSCTAHG